ncbi:ABC transporter ATP-binding protein [Planctomycetes bacterium K23_9]|uniref:Putative ABC transporter ATP-binding protein YxlF n=1 Tax=Stieleria marina TaxID=1930275 RepID=A0A517NZJ3_9BACT|nr:putative ABC transporter ATP-binding protein YxlF [Planctomycetes bacterium K23_9]
MTDSVEETADETDDPGAANTGYSPTCDARTDIVRCQGLSKRYGDFDALKDCDVRVRQGDVFGLLGPNGAGKTTLIRLLLGYLHPTGGSCAIAGLNPEVDSVAVRREVSYLPGDARLPRHMRGDGVLKFFSEIHPSGNRDKSHSIAKRLELDLRRRVAFMSTGMRQKLALAVVLATETPLLILDEPTANLDPTVRGEVLNLVREAQNEGRTVVFSSHVLSEIEETCDEVAFLRHGVLAHELKMAELFQRHRVTAKAPSTVPEIPDPLANSASITIVDAIGDREGRVTIDTAGDLAGFLPWINSLGLSDLRIEPLGLRSVYDAVHAGQKVAI